VATLHVRVVSPERVVFEGDASSVVAPAWDGQVGLLPGHAPMIVLLGVGPLDVDIPGGGSTRHYLAGGVLKVVDDRVTILTEYAGAEPPAVVPETAVVDIEEVLEDAAVAGNPLI
jgi:F-type H+-transporting ATPase subunit epsilon